MKAPGDFNHLSIEDVFEVAEACGFDPTGAYFQLNSYENRVFDLFLESASCKHVISKIYRPGRWSKDCIDEEHQFLKELKSQGIPAVAALDLGEGKTTYEKDGLIYCFFPKAIGRMPQEFPMKDYVQLGRQLAKLHNVGAQKQAQYRPTLNLEASGWSSLDNLQDWVAPEIWPRYEKAAIEILEYLEDFLDESQFIRIHGDCHRGNILQTDPKEGLKELFFVDFDDFINGPVVQDFWMLFSGDENESKEELENFLQGYEELRNFDRSQLEWMPALRGLRIIYYANWIARRWKDPSFPKIFPEFRNFVYWAEEVEALEKIAWHL